MYGRHVGHQEHAEQTYDTDWWVKALPIDIINTYFCFHGRSSLVSNVHSTGSCNDIKSELKCDNSRAFYSTDAALTHLDQLGHVHMVNVSSKISTSREAWASGHITLSPEAFELVKNPKTLGGKGSVMGVARIAGIMAAKNTAQLIPLCHTISLTHAAVEFDFYEEECRIVVRSCVCCEGVTGVEMEALTAVSVALLTVYDMTKSVSKSHTISQIQLESKSGGKSGHYSRKSEECQREKSITLD